MTAFLLVLVVFTSRTASKPGNVTRVAPRATSPSGTVRAVFSPTSNNLISVGDTDIPVQVQLNPQGTTTTVSLVQFKIVYNYTGATPELEVLDQDTTTLAGTQIQSNLPGTGWGGFTEYTNRVVTDATAKTVTIDFSATNNTGYILSGNSPVTFATIYFRAKALGSTSLTFNTAFTKVMEKSTYNDVLSPTLGAATLTVTNDVVAPVVTIGTGPGAGSVINSRTPSFAWTATDDRALNATPYAYSLSGPTPTAKTAYSTTNTAIFSSLADGAYTFTAYARDAASPPNEGNQARSFTVDATAPTVSISTGPAAGGVTNVNPVVFTFTGTDTRTATANLVYSYSMTGQSATAYGPSTTASFSNLTDGSKTFSVTSRDEAGNISAAATRTFTVDRTAPIVSLAATGPTGVINTNSGTFTWTGSDSRTGATVTYATRLDSGSWSTYSAATTYLWSAIPEGAHTFSVRAQDDAGNVSAVQTRSFTVDTTAPTVTITSGPSGTVNTNTATFTWSGSDTRTGAVITYSYRMDGGSWSAYSSSVSQTFSGLTNASHTFEVRAQDDAGNVSAVQSRTFTVSINGLLSFKIKFEGITAPYSANCPTRNVRVTLKNADASTVVFGPSIVVTTADAAGVYTGTLSNITVADGAYDVYLKGPAHKASKYTVGISPSTALQDWTTVPQTAGDLVGSMITARTNPDNAIDGEDWNRVLNNINSLLEIDPMSNFMDLNCDKRVEATDLITILNNIILEYGPGGEE